MALTPEQLAEIRARVEAATPGPWEWEMADQQGSLLGLGTKGAALMEGAVLGCERCEACMETPPGELGENSTRRCCWPRPADAEFIAHARQDVPDLLADREDLQRQLAEVTARAERTEAKLASLQQAIESIKARAEATPIGAEDKAKGASTYNWLMYVYRLLLEPALRENGHTDREEMQRQLAVTQAEAERANLRAQLSDERLIELRRQIVIQRARILALRGELEKHVSVADVRKLLLSIDQ